MPITIPIDPIDRSVEFQPTKSPYDPRHMLAGRENPSNSKQWISGFFDCGSWSEFNEPWAKTVVTGRARLGGIPIGVISVETRTVELTLPADPANLDSEAKTLQQAAQVWYPDSAYKTSQAIKDLGREEIPLMIFGNWRGFSGGMKDMYEQILKFGAYIIDGLREYKQPVFIYVPPNAELRGGAWAVIDPSINSRYMEAYADPDARAGVLEPEGTVEVRYREKDLIKTIYRLDPIVIEVRIKRTIYLLFATNKNMNSFYAIQLNQRKNLSKSEAESLQIDGQIKDRITALLPMYHIVAVHFADLQDTPVRLLEKGCLNDVIPWRESRKWFYWRLRRVLIEDQFVKKILDVNSNATFVDAKALLKEWFMEANKAVDVSFIFRTFFKFTKRKKVNEN